MIITKAEEKQLKEVSEFIEGQAFSLYSSHTTSEQYKNWIEQNASEKALLKKVEAGMLLVAFKNQTILGTINFSTHISHHYKNKSIDFEIGGLYVKDKRLGIGETLLKEVLNLAGEQQLRIGAAGVAEYNQRALLFFQKHGFKEGGQHTGSNMSSVVFKQLFIDLHKNK